MRLGMNEKIARHMGLCTVALFLGLGSVLQNANAQTFRPYSQSVGDWTHNYGNEVDVELVLAVDISQSMDADEQEVQRAGYVSALTSDEFVEAVQLGPIGKIAVVYMEWGGVGEHFVVADWAEVKDRKSAEAFAAQIAEAPLRQVQRTSISSALKKSVEMVETNTFSGLRKVIDISGDGPNNQGGPVTEMRDRLLSSGVVINGLPLMMKSNGTTWQAMLNLDHYYEDCVIGGPGSFAIPVRSKSEFADAIRMKLVMEVAGLTLPPPLVQTVSDRQPTRCGMFD
ncbi:hypothetical protein GCM10011316_32110 [Roseibium aquae]|uniref:VWFA domain-containing protein n=1 Tax=Roseibium aquae TaxID=1323746 RepID=A0A916TLP7_9HYPH|nr:DUF1194 domain-containing protein [Roseibium aquae]GGB57637.1 hypothetical protein GCM10011316_32110 [Roseibium aquae]